MGSIRSVFVDEMILRKPRLLFDFFKLFLGGQVEYIWGRGMLADIQLLFQTY